MPPTTSTTAKAPEKLKPYLAHRLFLDWEKDLTGVGAVSGDCPWCGREGKFNVTLSEGLWRCVVCNIGSTKGGGNAYTFLRVLHDLSMKATTHDDYVQLAAQRKLLFHDTLKTWGVCRSVIDGTWLVPGYSVQNGTSEGGKLTQLYRYVKLDGKMALLATAGLPHGLHGPDLVTPKGGLQVTKRERTGPVYRCEGPWDGMAFWEVASRCKRGDEGTLSPTSNPEAALTWTGSVIAVPGCGTFTPTWTAVSANRPDYSFYDNDHPREHPPKSGRFIQGGLDGTQRVVDLLVNASTPPKEMKYLRWGKTSYHDPNLAHGYDVRDHLAGPDGRNNLLKRIHALDDLLSRLQSPPQEWLPGRVVKGGTVSIKHEECRDWKTLLNSLREVGKPTDGIIRTFASCLASVLSVPSHGDQLWLMVVGPPSSFKSTIAEALSANRAYVLPKDTLTGLFSGWQMGLEKDQNLSLAGEMSDKTLVVKDADTVLQSPMCPQIMSQLRALYDRCVRVQYKNKMSKDWEGLNTTVIVFGTATLYQLDASEKGARFLIVDIQPSQDYDLEDEIAIRTAHKAFRNMTVHANGSPESRDTPEMLRFKQLTAGYINYLRENAITLVEGVEDPDGSALKMCAALATFCSYMRARPPKKQTEKVEREMPYRLTSQLVRLARGLAVVFNKRTIDKQIMEHVRAVALNTAHGKIMGLLDYLRAAGPRGTTSNLIAQNIGETHDETMLLLRFLRKIAAIQMTQANRGPVRTGRPFWSLHPRLWKLYDTIFGAFVPTTSDDGDDD